MAVTAGPPEAQSQRLKKLLNDLQSLVRVLPASLSTGTKDGPIAKNFSSHEYDAEEGPYFAFNRAWERTFQVSDEEQERRVLRGKYGLPLVLSYTQHFSAITGIDTDDGLFLIAERIAALIVVVQAV
jgi:hypothetical protein